MAANPSASVIIQPPPTSTLSDTTITPTPSITDSPTSSIMDSPTSSIMDSPTSSITGTPTSAFGSDMNPASSANPETSTPAASSAFLGTNSISTSSTTTASSSSRTSHAISTSTLISSSSGTPTSPTANSSTMPIQTSSPNHGLGSMAIAGIAVGCVFAGLIMGTIATFLFLRRRKEHDTEPAYLPMQRHNSFESKILSPTPSSAAAISDESQLDQFLLAPRPDNEIGGELRSLGHLIQQHVEDHYHLFPVQQSQNSLSQALVKLGLGEGCHPSTGELASLAADSRTRYMALQHIISRIVFGSVAVKATGHLSMLPPSIAGFVRTMPPIERHLGSSEALSLAFIRWRQLSVFLLNPNRSERNALVPEKLTTEQQARDLAANMNNFLGVFFEEQSRLNQESHLQDVIVECTKLGYVVLSQPAEFLFRFESQNSDEFVVHPGLDKISDDQGSKCNLETILAPVVGYS